MSDATASRSGPTASEGTPAFPINITAEELEEKCSFGYLIENEKDRQRERNGLRPVATLVSRLLARSESCSVFVRDFLKALGLDQRFDLHSFNVPTNKHCITVSNHSASGCVDGALLHRSIEQLGLSPCIISAANILPIDGIGHRIPMALPRLSLHDTRSESAIRETNALALEKTVTALTHGHGIGVFPSAGQYTVSPCQRKLVEVSFDRLLPILWHTKHLSPRIICVHHDFRIPQWWVDQFVSSPTTFYARQWEAALDLGPQTVMTRVIAEFDVRPNARFADLFELCTELREAYSNLQTTINEEQVSEREAQVDSRHWHNWQDQRTPINREQCTINDPLQGQENSTPKKQQHHVNNRNATEPQAQTYRDQSRLKDPEAKAINKTGTQIRYFLRAAENLKTELRHCVMSDGRPESVAEHTWRTALLAMTVRPFLKTSVNELKLLKMILVHDLVEMHCGNIPRQDYINNPEKKEKKKRLEREAIGRIRDALPAPLGDELSGLWNEYEDGFTNEARIARALDKLETQAQHNEAGIETWSKDEYHFVYELPDYTQNDDILDRLSHLLTIEVQAMLENAHGEDAILGG